MMHVAGLAAQPVVPGSAPAGTSPAGPVLPMPGGNFFLRCHIRKPIFAKHLSHVSILPMPLSPQLPSFKFDLWILFVWLLHSSLN